MERLPEKLKNDVRGKRILVTGGGGFIGSYLSEWLVRLGAKVVVFDVNPPNDPLEGAIYFPGDVCSLDDLKRAMKDVEMVFHFAGLVGVEKILPIPYKVMEVNLRGTINAIDSARHHGIQRFVLASSSEVYGQPRDMPISEDCDAAPISFYGMSKLAAEAYCRAAAEEWGLSVTILRYFNVYGPRQQENFVIPIFIRRALQGKPPIIYGPGTQSRCYTYIDDAIYGTILASFLPQGVGQVFNIGSDQEVTILELAHFITEQVGNLLAPVHRAFGDGIRVESREVLQRRPDIRKARTLLGFDYKVSWREGVKQMIEWYRYVHSREETDDSPGVS
jgi:UDP-glucose 4-epimerase